MTSISTIRQYESAWRDFERACANAGFRALPAEPATVLWYLYTRAATLTKSTRRKRIAAIRFVHRRAGYPPPEIGGTWSKAIEYSADVAQLADHTEVRVDLATLLSDRQKRVLGACPQSSASGLRDSSMFALMAGLGLSREQCAALDRKEIVLGPGSVSLAAGQKRLGRRALPVLTSSVRELDPSIALSGWLELAGIENGALFRAIDRHGNVGSRLSGRSIYNIVKRRAKEAGLEHFTPNMLRRLTANWPETSW